jgi:hypothetical protein
MKASGMCGGDLHQYRRPKSEDEAIGGLPVNPNPVVGGHDRCGVVAGVGATEAENLTSCRPQRQRASDKLTIGDGRTRPRRDRKAIKLPGD